MVDPALLEAAALRAARLGVGGDEVLRCAGILTPDQIAEGIGAHLGIDIDPLNEAFEPRSLAPPAPACCGEGRRREATITVAARGTGIRWLAERARRRSEARAPADRGTRAPGRACASVAADELAQEAVYGLHEKRPDHSAIGYGWAQLQTFTVVLAAAMLAAGIFAPGGLFIAIEYFLAFSFIGWTLLRLAACLFPRQAKPAFRYPRPGSADLHDHRSALSRGAGRRKACASLAATALSAREARHKIHDRDGRCGNACRDREAAARRAIRDHRAAAHRAADETEGARGRPSLRTRLPGDGL
jgi:hypothetical protein